jgi:nucleotide-binding universal stress UspA family protein
MYKKILVPLDGSEFAESSLEHVKAIAKGCNVPEVVLFASVEIVPVVTGMDGFVSADYSVQIEKQTLDWLKEYLAKIAGRLGAEGLTVKTAIGRGSAASEILDYAKKNNVDLIIMTTHGSSGLVRWALGSVTDRVVRHSECPVLTISPRGVRSSK